VQEGDAQVLLEARFNEAHGHSANAGAVFERIRQKTETTRWLIPHDPTVVKP